MMRAEWTGHDAAGTTVYTMKNNKENKDQHCSIQQICWLSSCKDEQLQARMQVGVEHQTTCNGGQPEESRKREVCEEDVASGDQRDGGESASV